MQRQTQGLEELILRVYPRNLTLIPLMVANKNRVCYNYAHIGSMVEDLLGRSPPPLTDAQEFCRVPPKNGYHTQRGLPTIYNQVTIVLPSRRAASGSTNHNLDGTNTLPRTPHTPHLANAARQGQPSGTAFQGRKDIPAAPHRLAGLRV